MNFFQQLFNADRTETNGQLLLFYIFETIVIYQVIFYAWEWGFYIPQLGDVILPLGMAKYIDVTFMFTGHYSLINAALITIFCLLGFFRKGRYCYLLAVIGMHLQYIARYSQGEISHGSNFTATVLLTLALGAAFIANSKNRRKIVLGLFIFLMGLGYTSASFCKLIASGPMWIKGQHLYLWISERGTDLWSQNGTYLPNFLQKMLLNYPWMASGTLLFGLLGEFFGFLLWFRKTRWIEATVLIAMHIGIYLSMRINFPSYMIILILLGYPWSKLLDYWLEKVPQSYLNRYLTRIIYEDGIN